MAYASVPLGIFAADGEMYNYTRDASRCLEILSINTGSFDVPMKKIDLR